jgi:hypothetical protein
MLAAVAAAVLPVSAATPALAAPELSETVGLAVSTQPEPMEAAAGTTVDTWLVLANTGAQPLEVRVRAVRLVPQDDGRLQVVDEPDPLWTGRVRLAATTTVPPKTRKRLPVQLDVPAESLPDLYLVGLLVVPITPDRPAGQVTVRGRILAVLTIEVPGPRERKLTVDLGKLPRLRIGHSIAGHLTIRNIGDATAQTRGQVRVDSATDGANHAVIAATGERQRLMPAGTSREFDYTWRTDRWFTLARPTALVTYGNGGPGLAEVIATGPPVLLLSPGLVVLIAALVTAAAAAIWRLIRRRRGTRLPLPAHRRSRIPVRAQ